MPPLQRGNQQLAKSGDSANNADAMGIAGLVLQHNDEPKTPDKDKPDAPSDAAVQAVISVLQGTPPQN